MDDERLKQLFESYAEDALTEAEAAELVAALAASPEARRELAADVFLHRSLLQVTTPKIDENRLRAALSSSRQTEVMQRIDGLVRRRSTRRRWIGAAAAVATLGAAAAAFWLLPGSPGQGERSGVAGVSEKASAAPTANPGPAPSAAAPGTVESPSLEAAAVIDSLEGEALVISRRGERQIARLGDAVPGGGAVMTSEAGGARLRTRSGVRLAMKGGSHVLFPSDGPTAVIAGTVSAEVGAAATLVTPQVEVQADRAQISLRVSGGASRVDVESGEAEIRPREAAGPARTVRSRQTAIARTAHALKVVPAGSPDVVLVVGPRRGESLDDRTQLRAGDLAVLTRLEGLGLSVRTSTALITTAELEEASLVVISESAGAGVLPDRMRYLARPILSWESFLHDELGLVDPRAQKPIGGTADTTELLIRSPEHSMAAGLSGRVRVTTGPIQLIYARPAPSATIVAVYPEDPERVLAFAVERGAPLARGGTAPNRRAGFFLRSDVATRLTDAGWALFDAAVRWCLEDAGR